MSIVEKRKYNRTRCFVRATFLNRTTGFIKDASVNGFRLCCRSKLQVGSTIEIKVDTLYGSILMQVNIIYANNVNYGCEIKSINNSEAWAKFVDSCLLDYGVKE